ncbi:MAG: hypothetical protein E7017_01335 [Alphaproteobacteria bacterium]|nr:hypothetical protein [Alphaproteobacteria bacterium]
MFNYKSTLALGTMLLLPFSVFADTCATLPKCADLGFVNTADECGKLAKLKCPFDDTSYFCSTNNCKSVSVGGYEVCTEYCAEDKNVCVGKRAMTCDEALKKTCNYRIYDDGDTISGTITEPICIKGTVKQASGYGNSLKFVGATIWDAGKLYDACKTEMGNTKAKLELSYVTLENNVTFYTDVDISTVYFYPNSSNYWSASFYGDSRISVYYQSNSTWSNALYLNFGSYYGADEEEDEHTSIVKVYCDGGSDSQWNPAKCSVGANNYYENHAVTLCGQIYSSSSCGSSGTCYKELDLTCNGQENSSEMCTIAENGYSGTCSTYW